MGVDPKIAVFTPPKSSILIEFGTIIFTIHFGGQIPLFLVQHANRTVVSLFFSSY